MAQIPTPRGSLLNAELAKYPRLDPRAVRAVAAQEGLGGGIGDQGTSFGPFQLHYGGAYPSSAPHGAQASQAWAWSPAGIDYALGRIEGVAGGLRGGEAVSNIVSRFERPANIPHEIAGALASYGGSPGSYGSTTGAVGLAPPSAPGPAAHVPAAPVAPPDLEGRRQAVLALISSFGQQNQQNGLQPLMQALQQYRNPAATPAAVPPVFLQSLAAKG